MCGSQTGFGCGTVFKLKPLASPEGGWTETVLHSFAVINGKRLFGTTPAGGAHNSRTVFNISF
jgi:hypothetical protein